MEGCALCASYPGHAPVTRSQALQLVRCLHTRMVARTVSMLRAVRPLIL